MQTPDGEQQSVLYADLKIDKKAAILKGRVKDYSRRIHKRHKDTVEELREDVVCQVGRLIQLQGAAVSPLRMRRGTPRATQRLFAPADHRC